MAADERWYFTREQLANTPSRRCGIDADKELSYRQQAANFIQDMGQRLVVYPFYRITRDVSVVLFTLLDRSPSPLPPSPSPTSSASPDSANLPDSLDPASSSIHNHSGKCQNIVHEDPLYEKCAWHQLRLIPPFRAAWTDDVRGNGGFTITCNTGTIKRFLPIPTAKGACCRAQGRLG